VGRRRALALARKAAARACTGTVTKSGEAIKCPHLMRSGPRPNCTPQICSARSSTTSSPRASNDSGDSKRPVPAGLPRGFGGSLGSSRVNGPDGIERCVTEQLAKVVAATGGPAAAQVKRVAGCSVNRRECPLTGTWHGLGTAVRSGTEVNAGE
jgi:hypothetical protein